MKINVKSNEGVKIQKYKQLDGTNEIVSVSNMVLILNITTCTKNRKKENYTDSGGGDRKTE